MILALQGDGSMLERNRSRVLALLLAAALVAIGCSAANEEPTPVPSPEVTAAPTPTPEPTLVPTPTPKPLAVKITKLTKSAAPGDTASVTIKTTKGAACSITVTYESGDSEAKGLGNKKANAEGVVTWKWSVGLNTNPQTAGLWISCGAGARSGHTQADIVIK